MLFLTLYTPAQKSSHPPSPEHMARMTALMEKATQAGTLVQTGGLGMSATAGARVRLSKGEFSVDRSPSNESGFMRAAGWALLRASSREDAVQQCREFLEVAGDGESELLQVLEGPPPR
jgi:hypothetical protein